MKIVKEAYTDSCKVVYDPEYVTIQQTDGEPVHMSINEAKEIVEWLSHELNRVLPEIIPTVKNYENVYEPVVSIEKQAKAAWGVNEPVYDPGDRTAVQTVEIKLGDPNLPYRNAGGRTAISGDGEAGVMDLGALAAKVGKV